MYEFKLTSQEIQSQATEIYNSLIGNDSQANITEQASKTRTLAYSIHKIIQGYQSYYEYIIECVFEALESKNFELAKSLMIPLLQHLQKHHFFSGQVNYEDSQLRRLTNFKRLNSIFKSPHNVQYYHFAAQDAKRILLNYHDEIKNCGNPTAYMKLDALIEGINILENMQKASRKTKKQEKEWKVIEEMKRDLSALLREFEGVTSSK